jgi:hypothetical protein
MSSVSGGGHQVARDRVVLDPHHRASRGIAAIDEPDRLAVRPAGRDLLAVYYFEPR